MEGTMPKDPVMLLSYINTQLRDHYKDLDDLCQALGADRKQIETVLEQIDYIYDKGYNQFV